MSEAQAVVAEPGLEERLREQLDAEYQKKLQEQVNEIAARMSEENKTMVTEAIEKIKKDMAPPSQEDLQKLLNQEYLTFKLDIPVTNSGKTEKRTFVIRELPQAIEKRMFDTIKTTLMPFASELASLSMNLMEGDASKKIVQLINTFEPILNLMTEIAAVCLDPFGTENIDANWVKDHLSSNRIAQVVTVQAQCNRLRDFFALLFQGSKLAGQA